MINAHQNSPQPDPALINKLITVQEKAANAGISENDLIAIVEEAVKWARNHY